MKDEKAEKDVALSAESAREIILARRARFVAAALAGIGTAGCELNPGPQVCLSIQGPGRDAGDTSSEDGGPRVCLSLMPDAGPQVCLSQTFEPCLEDFPRPSECPPLDAGLTDGGCAAAGDGGVDGGCAPAGDGGADAAMPDAGPQVCLSFYLQEPPERDEDAS